MWLLFLSSRTVLSYTCILRLASSSIVFFFQSVCRGAGFWRLTDHQQLEDHSSGLPRTDWDKVLPFFLWTKWIFLKYLLPVVDFYAIGHEEHEKDTICQTRLFGVLFMREAVAVQFLNKVRVKQRPCNPEVRRWANRRIMLSLSTFRTSTLCSLFLYCRTRWHQFCSEYIFALSSRPWFTKVSNGPARYCFHVCKNIFLHLL